jgi:hypothetical protein
MHHSRRSASRSSPSYRKIGTRELARVRAQGAEVLRWQQRFGLAKAQQMCVGLLLAGLVPFAGLLLLGWNPAAMLVYLAIDVLGVLAGDVLKLLFALPVLRHTHAQDHQAQAVLGVVGGLEDGTGTYTETGSAMSPLLLFGIALLCTAFLLPVLAASFEALGLGAVQQAIAAPWFREIAAGSFALHLLQSLGAALAARRHAPGEQALYLDAGGVIGLFIGLLVLVWLPLVWGANGVVAMLVVVFVFKLGFGAFAMVWMPRVTRALQRFLAAPATDDPALLAALK